MAYRPANGIPTSIKDYFVVDTATEAVSREGWTANERDVMADHRWWSREALCQTTETIYPEGLVAMLDAVGAFKA